jgi:ADP-ribose pyrophosphatase YjhB (NUDIX family)
VNRPEVCVGAVVVHDGCLLLIQRGRGAGIGSWSIPGGRVEFGETLEQAAARELHEETGLLAGALRYLGHVERVSADWHFVIHDYLVDVAVESLTRLAAGDDALATRWVRLAEVPAVEGLVPGLVEFLSDRGVLSGGSAPDVRL